MQTTTRTFVNTLNANDVFSFPGCDTPMVCESRFSEEGATSLTYRIAGTREVFSVVRPGLSTVDLYL